MLNGANHGCSDPASGHSSRRTCGLRNARRAAALIALLLLPARLPGQSGGGHTLFGDLKVDESEAPRLKPNAFQVMLCKLSGEILVRQTVSPGGRYRFLDVRNGEYYLVVEMGTEEVARIHLLLMEQQKTDIRRDIELAWHRSLRDADRKAAATVSVKDYYRRDEQQTKIFGEALAANKLKDYARAAALLESIVAADPKDFEAWSELGTAHFLMSNHREAERCYRRSLQERPSFPLALMNLGKLQMVQKKYEEAVASLAQLVEAEPRSADAQFLLGEAYLQIRKGSKAEVHFKEALRLDPVGQADAHLRLGALYNAAGYRKLAADQYEQFLAKRPDHPERKRLQEYIRRNKQ